MNELRTLLTLELRGMYGINKYLHTKDRKEKNRYRLLGAAWIVLAVMAVTYVGGLVYGLCSLRLGEIVPSYLVMLSSLLILAFGIFTAGNRIFGQKGYDLLASLPVKTRSIVLSRMLALYAEDLLLTALILIPGMVVYGFLQRPAPGYYLAILPGIALIPAIPQVISVLLGSLILAVSSRMKNKSLVQTGLMMVLVVGILLGSFRMGSMSETITLHQFSQLAAATGAMITRVYPPAVWLGNGLPGAGLFTLASVLVMVFAVWVISRNYQRIQRRLLSFSAKHTYKMGTLERRGLLKALYLREAKRYFSSSIYVTNTIIGPIMGTILAVAVCVSGIEATVNSFPLPLDIPGLLPYVFAAVFCTMTTTAVSISMEGKQVWVVKSLPIPAKLLLDSKLLLNLSLMLPFFLVSEIALIIALKPDAWQLLWLILIPASVIGFSLVFGITVNLKFHSFGWEKEEVVVKQSLPSVLGGFAGFLLAAALGAASALVPGNAVKGITCAAVVASAAWLYRKNSRTDLAKW